MADAEFTLATLVARYKIGTNQLTQWLFATVQRSSGLAKARELAQDAHEELTVTNCRGILALSKLIPASCGYTGRAPSLQEVNDYIKTTESVIRDRNDCTLWYSDKERDDEHEHFIDVLKSVLAELKKAYKLLEGSSKRRIKPEVPEAMPARRDSNYYEHLPREPTPPSSPPKQHDEDSGLQEGEGHPNTGETPILSKTIAIEDPKIDSSTTPVTVDQAAADGAPDHEEVPPERVGPQSEHPGSDIEKAASSAHLPVSDAMAGDGTTSENLQAPVEDEEQPSRTPKPVAPAARTTTPPDGGLVDQAEATSAWAPDTTTTSVRATKPTRASARARRNCPRFLQWAKHVALDLDARPRQCRKDEVTKHRQAARLRRDHDAYNKAYAQQLAKIQVHEAVARSTLDRNQSRRQRLMSELARAHGLLDERQDEASADDIAPETEPRPLQKRRERLQQELELLPGTELMALQQKLGLDRTIRGQAAYEADDRPADIGHHPDTSSEMGNDDDGEEYYDTAEYLSYGGQLDAEKRTPDLWKRLFDLRLNNCVMS